MNTTLDLSNLNIPFAFENGCLDPTNRSPSIQDLLEEFNKDERPLSSRNPQSHEINNSSLQAIGEKRTTRRTRLVISRGLPSNTKLSPAKLLPFQINLLQTIRPSVKSSVKDHKIGREVKTEEINELDKKDDEQRDSGKDEPVIPEGNSTRQGCFLGLKPLEKKNGLSDRRPTKSWTASLLTPKDGRRILLPKIGSESCVSTPNVSPDSRTTKASSLINVFQLNKDEFKDKMYSPKLLDLAKDGTSESSKRKAFFPSSIEGSSLTTTVSSQQGLNFNLLKNTDTLYSKTSLESPTYKPIIMEPSFCIKSAQGNKEWKFEGKPGRRMVLQRKSEHFGEEDNEIEKF